MDDNGGSSSSGLERLAKEHPAALIGGAVGLGLVFFMLAGNKGNKTEPTVQTIANQTGSSYVSPDMLANAIADSEARIIEQLQQQQSGGPSPSGNGNGNGNGGEGDNGGSSSSGGQPPNPHGYENGGSTGAGSIWQDPSPGDGYREQQLLESYTAPEKVGINF